VLKVAAQAMQEDAEQHNNQGTASSRPRQFCLTQFQKNRFLMSYMQQISVKYAERTYQSLLLSQRYTDLERVLSLAARDVQTARDWDVLRQIHERIPSKVLLASDSFTCGYAKTLVGSRRINELFDFTATALPDRTAEVTACLKLERSWAFITEGQWQEACQVLESIFPDLYDAELGIAHRRYGLAAFKIGQPWQNHFVRAKALLNGRALGLAMLDEGHCLERSGQNQEARVLWMQASPHFKKDVFHTAFIHFSIGITALRDDEPDGEQHLRIAEELTRSESAAGFRADVLIGLCTARRVRGEWARAEASARAAIRIAKEPATFQQAYFDLARTLRLAGGRLYEALEQYQNAHEVMPNAGEAHVSLAACYLALGDANRAREWLRQAGPVTGFSVWLRAIVLAELARQSGDDSEMLKHLEGLPLTMLYVREEVDAWPDLFARVRSLGHAVPLTLERIAQTVVRVEALGVLRVLINQQPVVLPPTSRLAELLVFLLENHGQASLERLRDVFWPNAINDLEHRRARKALWNMVERLRDALAWPDSVLAVGSAYRLDPGVIWEYDVTELRQGSVSTNRLFMDGVYSDWVLEVRNGLE
jgi:tetratricopeptide (TPR) repeat protein